MGISPEQWAKVKEIYEAALEKSPADRTAYVNRQTSDDLVRNEVLRLLTESDRIGTFLSTPPFIDYRSPRMDVQERLPEGQLLAGRFRIISFIAAGGMGEVYKVEDTRLGRVVVLKFLPQGLGKDPISLERFRQEAKSSSSLNHPNISTVYDFGEDSGRAFIAMEYLEGETVSSRLKSGPFTLKEALKIALEVSSALNAAHGRGIVHRDVKPGNIMLTATGAKLLDFGLAKHESPATAMGDVGDCFTDETGVVGTLSYMSPEQLLRRKVDARTDIFSFGAVLYEMLTGTRALHRELRGNSVIDSGNENPQPISDFVKNVPNEVESLIKRCLTANPENRYQSLSEVQRQLQDSYDIAKEPIGGVRVRALLRQLNHPLVAVSVLLALLLGLGGLGYWFHRGRSVAWAKEQALPRISKLIQQGKISEAYNLAEEAERYIPQNPELQKIWPDISWSEPIVTKPAGASVYRRNYNEPTGHWEFVGRTPIQDKRFPAVDSDWRFELNGYRSAERATFPSDSITVTLDRESEAPSGMVRVQYNDRDPSQKPRVNLWGIAGFEALPSVSLNEFWIDRFEVTNAEYKKFVDQGGYKNKTYWKHEFNRNGSLLPWAEAMKLFVDSTGRPGPAAWRGGEYPTDEEDYPVTGISWFEAEAYAEFVGKSLPTIYHWTMAASPTDSSSLIPASNFSGKGPAQVGKYKGMSWCGAYDMAGNVKEWCSNEAVPDKRYLMGGAWDEPTYMFNDADARSPFERSSKFGFRCAKYTLNHEDEEAKSPISLKLRNYGSEQPVSDQLFRAYKEIYSYDKTALNSHREVAQETNEWKMERITFDAAYSGERVIAFLFLPKNATPPFQTVVYFPGAGAVHMRSSGKSVPLFIDDFGFIIQSGRALLFPIYKGTFERGAGNKPIYWPNTSSAYRDYVVEWAKDLGRSVDYLESRPDIDHGKLAYDGYSWGAAMGGLLPAVETRFKALVLVSPGFYLQDRLPEVDQVNFAPRVKVPVLMLNGRYDFIWPPTISQEPMFRLLGTPAEQKRRVVYDTGHDIPRNELMKETLGWLDRYLGPTK
jgi:serine/threonine protein kinase/cephalosporin-C deacetylase-like acetyl esterase